MVGTIIGLSKKTVRERFDDIVAFAGLEEYVDTRVFQLSRGLRYRLGFSLVLHSMEHAQPDILLLDEVFSKGADSAFQERATARLQSALQSGAAVVLVSHNLDTIKQYTHRVLWLEKGAVMSLGTPEQVLDAYRIYMRSAK